MINGMLPIRRNTIRRIKRGAILLALCFLVFNLFGCRVIRWNPTGDWDYEDLPNGYTLMRVNSRTIVLQSPNWLEVPGEDWVTTTRIYSYISAICNNERYIAVKWTDPDEIDFEKIKEHDFSTAKYYIVDSTNDDLYGPYDTEEAFLRQCEELSVGEFSEWINTLDMPSVLGDKYYDW